MTKKILITGGAGFIGLNLANKLANIGYKVDIADNFNRAKIIFLKTVLVKIISLLKKLTYLMK